MEQAIFTTLCMVTDGKGNVLVQERTGQRWPGIAFPGGHVEPGEPFLEAAVREVQEETGITPEDTRLCGVKQFTRDDGSRYVIFLYRASRFHGQLCASPEGNVMWVRRSELEAYPLAPDMAAMLPVFEDDSKSEFCYYEENGKWTYKVV